MKIKHLFIGLLLAATTPGIMAQPIKKQYFVSKAGTLISMMTRRRSKQCYSSYTDRKNQCRRLQAPAG